MMATLSQNELIEAIKEWCDRRGIPVVEDIEFHTRHVHGPQSTLNSSPNYQFYVQIRGIEMPVREGPYR